MTKKHTSINLEEEHIKKIEASGKSASEVIREALSLYFQEDSRIPMYQSEARRLIQYEMHRNLKAECSHKSAN
jgi:hypothetical protein